MENANFEPATDFYFWAASNASMETFPTNKPQKFRNKFAQSMALGNGWELALCEVYYPNNYHFNTEKLKESAIISLLYGELNASFRQRNIYTITPSTYTTDESIVATINTVLSVVKGKEKPGAQIQRNALSKDRWELVTGHEFCEIYLENEAAEVLFWQLGFCQLKYYPDGVAMGIPVRAKHAPVYPDEKKSSALLLYLKADKSFIQGSKIIGNFSGGDGVLAQTPTLHGEVVALDFKWSEGTDKLLFHTDYRDAFVRFGDQASADLFKSLGFYGYKSDPGVFTFNKLPIIAADPVLSIAQRPALFIYCDKIEYQFVGDTRAPLLLTVPVEAPWDRQVVWLGFQRLTYVPVRSGYINDIEFAITDDQGNPVQFKKGKVILKLHFRKTR